MNNKQLQQLAASLVVMGYPLESFCVSGGYCRDNVLGEGSSKDVDFVIVGEIETFNEVLLPDGWHVDQVFEDDYIGNCGVKSEDFDKRIKHVIKLKCSEFPNAIDVDLIYAKDRFADPADFIAELDFNINQWAWPALSIISGKNYQPAFIGPSFGTLVATRDTQVTPERKLRMVELAKHYGWDVSAFEQGDLL